jgi:hypothetical protein
MALIEFESGEFRQHYNRLPFKIRHNLADHSWMQLDRLKALALRMPKAMVLHRNAKVPVNADFDTTHVSHANGLTLEQTLDTLEACGGYVVLNRPEEDPEFGPFANQALEEIRAQTEPIDPGLYWHATYIFISAQGSVTPYHMDREMNFLMQMKGRKEVLLWDPLVMSELEREKLMTNFDAQRPQFREELRARAQRYEIGPGDGVHHPFIAPHLVTNGPTLSISWAFTFRTRGSDRKGHVLKMNHYLRKLGLTPSPEGESEMKDRIKDRGYQALQPLVARARKVKSSLVG